MAELLTANIVRGICAAKNQQQAAVYYAAGVLMGAYARPPLPNIDWAAINQVVLVRWTVSGLERVKKMGWRAAQHAARQVQEEAQAS